MESYTMANSTNVMYVCWYEWYTHVCTHVSLYEQKNEWKGDLAEEEAEAYIHPAGQSMYHPQNPYIISTRQAYPVRPELELYGG